MPESAADPSDSMPPAPLVAIAGWLVPGAGYWLLGHRARAIIVGATIISLFLAGTLIGGVRAIQVPGYGEEGGRLYVVPEKAMDSNGRDVIVERVQEHRAGHSPPEKGVWVMSHGRLALGEIGNKPWSICQVLSGPVALLGGAASVRASRPVATETDDGVRRLGEPLGALSHSRINEIAVLYTAVAGMLNLLAIIDAAARAGRPGGLYSPPASGARGAR
jgi:hypothetical protein